MFEVLLSTVFFKELIFIPLALMLTQFQVKK